MTAESSSSLSSTTSTTTENFQELVPTTTIGNAVTTESNISTIISTINLLTLTPTPEAAVVNTTDNSQSTTEANESSITATTLEASNSTANLQVTSEATNSSSATPTSEAALQNTTVIPNTEENITDNVDTNVSVNGEDDFKERLFFMISSLEFTFQHGSEPAPSHTEKSCIVSYCRQLPADIK